MARWQSRRSVHGSASRIVLHGLLRRAHVVTVRCRRHGSALGRSLDWHGDGRKAFAEAGLLADCDWRWFVDRELAYVVLGGRAPALSKLNGRLKPLPRDVCATACLSECQLFSPWTVVRGDRNYAAPPTFRRIRVKRGRYLPGSQFLVRFSMDSGHVGDRRNH